LEVAKGNQWPAEIPSIVLSAIEGAFQPLRVSTPTIRVEPLARAFVEGAAVVLGAAAPGREFNVRAALRARVRAESASFHRYFLDRAQTHRNGHEEDGAAALETVRGVIDPIDSNVDGAAGQVVVSRAASGGRRGSGSESGQSERAAAVPDWELGNCL